VPVTVVVVFAVPEKTAVGGGVLESQQNTFIPDSGAYMVVVVVTYAVSSSVLVGAVTVTVEATTLVVSSTVVVQRS
jgi:hypothetical protein